MVITNTQTIPGHNQPIYTIAFNYSTNTLFTAGADSGVVVWDADTYKPISLACKVTASVYALSVHNHFLAVGLRSGTVHILNNVSFQPITEIKQHLKPIFDVLFWDNYMALACEDGTVSIWHTDNFTKITQIQLSPQAIRTLCIKYNKLLAAGRDGFIYTIDSNSWACTHKYKAHEMPIFSLSNINNTLWSGSRDAQINIWENDALLKNIPAHWYAVNHICLHPTLNIAATASMDKSIKIWNTEDYTLQKVLNVEKAGIGHTHSVNKLTWINNGNTLCSVSDDKLMIVWDIAV